MIGTYLRYCALGEQMKVLINLRDRWHWWRVLATTYPTWLAFNKALDAEKRASYQQGFAAGRMSVFVDLMRKQDFEDRKAVN
jgi:hypothetical protein